jgi:hypothetical protein
MVTRKTPAVRIAFAAAFLVLALALVPVALAGKGKPGGGGGGGGTCTQNAPTVSVENNWEWGATGSWGLPGQQLAYDIAVTNNDVGCGSSAFTVSLSAPSGFSVSLPTNSITVSSTSIGYLWVYVTSPSVIADGDYPLTVTVQRGGATASSSTYYKVYSADTTAPTLFWANPGNGTTISGKSYNVTVSSSDDHAVKSIDLYIDNVYVSTKACDDLTYICQLNYNWAARAGQHTATFKSTDWMGNVGVLTVTFTVS